MPVSFASSSFSPATPSYRTIEVFSSPVDEGTTATYAVTIKTSAGGAIANTDITAATLTVIDEETHQVVNSRNAQNILGSGLGANNVVISVTADITWSLQAADTAVIDPTRTKKIEYHRAIFKFTTLIAAVTEISIHEVRFPIRPAFQLLNIS